MKLLTRNRMKGMKRLSIVMFILSTATLFISCSTEKEEIQLKLGKTYKITVEGKDAYFEIINGEDEMSLGLVRGESFLLGSYLGAESFELIFKKEGEKENVTIKDTNGDGLPDYRMIKNLETGKILRESIDSIFWKREE